MHSLSAEHTRLRDTLAIVLTVLTGATDAVAFLRLGNVFTSVMTGNMVLLGLAMGRGELTALEHAGLAVAAFVAGSVAGSHLAGAPRDEDGAWPRRLTLALAAELGIFVAVAAGWWVSRSHPAGLAQSLLLAASALALGVQSSAILRLNVSGLSTTYLTGTLTTLVQALTTARRLQGNGRSLCLLIALIAGAGLGALLATQAPAAVPLVPLVILAAVIATAELRFPAAPDAGP